jgi:D-glycero-alpha-D-manno-heptose-7-phosphate kinase
VAAVRPDVTARAPVRVCDLGGWTDTWFAGHGVVCSVAVQPGVDVEIGRGDGVAPVTLSVPDFGDRYGFDPRSALPGRHPLLEAVVASMPPPTELAVAIEVRSGMPPGSGVGTSAAVVVALLGALDALTPGQVAAGDVARAAHRVETVHVGNQSGVQDQLAAAHGGINLIEVDRYPHTRVSAVAVPADARAALGRRLVHVYLGRPHRSSAVHEHVIAALGEDADAAERDLDPLRRAASEGASALEAGDLDAYGAALVANTRAQAALHPALVSADAWRVIALARAHGAAGWKVNGAGGGGGSVTLLGPSDTGRCARLAVAVEATGRDWQVIPITLAREGLSVRSEA